MFLKVAECGSISAAADALGMAQPVLSRQIRNLENELSAKVFDRHSRGVVPNEAGHTLIEAARSIDANYRSALRHLSEAQAATSGQTRIGATPSWLQTLLPETIARVSKRHPSAKIKVRAASAETLLNSLLRAQLDLVMVPLETTKTYSGLFDTEVLYASEFTVFGAARHSAAAFEPARIEDLEHCRWVLPRHSYGRHLFAALYAMLGSTMPQPVIEVDNAQMVYEIVANSSLLSFGMLPPPDHPLSAQLCRINCRELTKRVDQGCVTIRKATLNPLCMLVRQELRAICRDAQGKPLLQTT